MFPDSCAAHVAHIGAVGVFFETYGPECFRSGVMHSLFQGFRPLLVRFTLPFLLFGRTI